AADGGVYFSAMPNAGLPTRVDERFLYVSSPAYFADYARRFVQSGVRLVGGCCGTTPRHIAAMRAALDEMAPEQARVTRAFSTAGWPRAAQVIDRPTGFNDAAAEGTPGEAAPASRLAAALQAGRFAVSVELDPPKGLNPTKIVEGARHLRGLGVEFINIADSPMARVRMSCLALAHVLRTELDVEPIIHFTTRDRNVMAIQSDLLGAHALGVHNILALTGDPLHVGNYPNLTGVWNLDSVGLIGLLRGMNDGHDAAGASLGAPASFHVGAALNLNMEDVAINQDRERIRRKLSGSVADDASPVTEIDLELARLRDKLEAGAQYIMTQPIYDLEPLEQFFERFGPVKVPILLGLMPLHSSKHAEYLHNEVPGISIPEAARARLREAGERAREVGIEMAREVALAARARGLVQGCYLIPSYGRYDLVGDLASELLR
ncbi:MAG TPA: methylenetetrahydrofolate reductase, partial [Ktedonobacterales bacterium]|nr:methylenetetrahydrofolate reductase [Ktedonobacterales bacterium]